MWKCIRIVVQYDEQLLLPLLNTCCYLCGFNVTKCWCPLCVVMSFKCSKPWEWRFIISNHWNYIRSFGPAYGMGIWCILILPHWCEHELQVCIILVACEGTQVFNHGYVGTTNPWDFCNLNQNEVNFLNCWNPCYISKV